MKTLFLAAILTVISAALWLSSPASAAPTDPSPQLFQSFAGCYRSIIQDDDLFCVNRYQLPVSDGAAATPEEWCKYLVDQNGCTDSPVNPDSPYSLQSGIAYITMYDGATLLGQADIPRIGYSLGGVYFPAGHLITWGDTNVMSCVESSATYFTTFEQACVPVTWNTAANTQTDQREQLGIDLVAAFRDLETANPLIPVNGYVVNNLINTAGREIALETLNVIDRFLPDTFQTSAVTAITDSYATPTGPLGLQTDVSATAAAFRTSLDGTGASFGMSGDAVGMLLFLVLGALAFAAVQRLTAGAIPLALVTFLTVFLAGVPLGAVPVAVASVTILLVFAVGVLFALRRMVFA